MATSIANKKDNFDWLIKILLIGDSGVGKTNVLLRFCENNFQPTYLSTIGIDFKIKSIDVEGKKIKMQIWDTAGQERFKTITQTYYKGAMGIILVYSIDDKDSFNNISNWMNQIKQHASENVCKLLIGNKIDVPNRQVSKEEGEQLAKSFGVPFFETSAKEGTNVADAFFAMAKAVKANLQNEKQPNPSSSSQNGIQLVPNNAAEEKKKSGCC
ncbi:unnamed protein product [Paramecium pentaurelia]|uniref:Ras-related protein Rab-1 n=1 Tax=Paramecium pentaurelia TaxID=43138 RepID=A0A8S1UH70_9CILI|nr:unnamed protein product [Paramecium pentaurelia]